MNVLIINGHIRWARISQGRLHRSINRIATNAAIKQGHALEYCDADKFYLPLTEVEKLFWADRIIIHFPINWFGLPGKFKTYLDTIFLAGEGQLYHEDHKNGEPYGTGGLLFGKLYFLVVTWGAQSSSFNDPLQFYEGESPDSVIRNIHYMFKFLGMINEGVYHLYNVQKSNRIAEELELCKEKLNDFLLEKKELLGRDRTSW